MLESDHIWVIDPNYASHTSGQKMVTLTRTI